MHSSDDGYTREDVTCLLCGLKDEQFLYHTPERIVRCRRCGLVYTNPRLDRESRARVYTEDYFVGEGTGQGIDYKAYANYLAEEALIVKSMHRRLEIVERTFAARGRLLDVGCAAGFSLIAAGERGWAAEGIELAQFCTDYAHSRGLQVHQGTLQNFAAADGTFDLVTMWDYLEHSPDPLADLQVCGELLRPGGVVALSIPNVDSWSFALFGQKWIGFKNIDHLYFFSRATLALLAERAGFRVQRCFYHGRDVPLAFFLNRMQYYIFFKPLMRALEKIAAHRKIRGISFYINPFDILNVILVKKQLPGGGHTRG